MVTPNNIFISVIMPVYNCELYICEAVGSILNQTFSNFEFLIIDDASTDKTVEIIQKYNDSRIQLIIKPQNTGLSNSLNYGLSIARGKYIARMDGDDISLPERFEKQVAFLEDNPDVVVCGTIFSIFGSDKIVKYPENHEKIKFRLLIENCVVHPSVMIRKQVLDEYSIIYDISKEPAEDYDLWIKLISKGKFYNIQEALLKYRFHDSQVSNKRLEQQIKTSIKIKVGLLISHCSGILIDEKRVLEKIIKDKTINDFDKIKTFSIIKQKIIESNSDLFFEPNMLYNYFYYKEKNIVRCFFLNRKNFTPRIYIQYLKIKNKLDYKIPIKEEFKLFIKSTIFWKVKKK